MNMRRKIASILTAMSTTAAMFIAADAAGGLDLSNRVVHVLGVVAGVLGILGRSPIVKFLDGGKDAAEGDAPKP